MERILLLEDDKSLVTGLTAALLAAGTTPGTRPTPHILPPAGPQSAR